MDHVAHHPAFDSVLHKSKVDDGLAPRPMAVDLHRFTVWTMRSSLVTDRGVWLWFVMARGGWHTAAWDFFARLHIDTLPLIIPIGFLVDGFHFRQRERNAAEVVWAFPLHVGGKNHFSLRRLAASGRRAMQVDQSVRHELKGFAVLPVVIE